MSNIDMSLTGRDVIAKTFSTRTRRGYDPIEVDAYLEQLATHIDAMHAEIDRLGADRPDFSTAPPPPPPPADAVLHAAAVDAPTGTGSEAAELVLRMAQKASGEALDEAKVRADEIVAEAEFKASEVQREADRKAFDVSTRTQSELRSVETEIEGRQAELDKLRGTLVAQRDRLRRIGSDITNMADGIEHDIDQETVLDLTDDAVVTVDAETDTADVT